MRRAVVMTLRETAGDDEFVDVAVRLPEDYVSALDPVRARTCPSG